MASSTTIVNDRKFIVKGQLKCLFTPDETEFSEEISNLTIELWQKSPLNIFFLGNGRTDVDGNFVITFEVNDQTAFLTNDAIENVFAKVFYRGELISGENPYPDEEVSKRPIRNITLREGLTDIGTYELEITQFEYPVDAPNSVVMEKPVTAQNSILFDIKEASSGQPLPTGYRCTFRGYISEEPNELTLFSVISDTTKEGYSELVVPQLPAVVKQVDEEFVINLNIAGIPATPSQECYLRLYIGETVYCTQITNFVIHEGKLSVYSEGNYYYVHDFPENLEDVTIIGFSETGQTAYYHSITETWETNSGFVFYQMQYPENLTKVANGIYAPNERVGTIVSGQLGTESFAPFSLSVENQGVIPINVELRIEAPTKETIFFGSFTNLLPGSKNFVMVETENFPAQPDESPTIGDIETISGVIFSVDFMNFLNSKGLTTLDKVKQAGPIRYIDGFPSGSIKENELAIIQGHVDLYTVNASAEQNQHLINQGYDNLYKIAETPKDVFLNEVGDPSLPLYNAARMHETVVQNQKLLSNILSAKMGDYELQHPFMPDIPGSTFANTAFSKFTNRCECEDCTSAVSPFSYMVDLLKYGAKHIKKTGTPSYSPVNYNAFLTLLENYFFQPFGSFSVDCDTLHREYCRMRLVTEVLEQLVATKTLPSDVVLRLANDRKNFILLTYTTLLTQAGSSYDELRNVVSIQAVEDKETAARSLSDKLGIPLYIPGTSVYTADRMWLTFDSADPNQLLNAENLELIFGFRDTQRDVLTNPPASLVSEWKDAYLFELWKKADYLFSAYSREDVDPNDDNTFKPEWKPIIDPDSFGRSDMTYQSSDFALALWRNRKANTDDFLNQLVIDSNVLERTSADILGRILRVPGKNIDGVIFQNDEVRIKNPSNNQFVVFKKYATALNGANTDVVLKKPTQEVSQPAMFQPEGTAPVMRYDSVIQVVQPLTEGATSVTLDWGDTPVILNNLTNGRVQLISKDDDTEEIYIYDPLLPPPPAPLKITSVTVVSESEVTLVLTPALSEEFINRTISFVYEAEVNLDTTVIPDPVKICNTLFTINFDYTYLPPAPSGMTNPFFYKVWDDPGTWPGSIGAEPTYYKKLKKLYEMIRLGTTDSDYLSVVTDNLHTTVHGFSMLMDVLLSCEQYLGSMYSYDKPSSDKLFQMASVARNCARLKLNEIWVKEEIKHIPSGGTNPEELMLDARYFWKALNEPQTGSWDGSLQTIPDDVLHITTSDVPIIDPELVTQQQLLVSPDTDAYRELYNKRQQQLDEQRVVYFDMLYPFDTDGFTHILNHINTGNPGTGSAINYDISPYTTLKELIEDFESTNEFLKLKATNVLQESFSLTADAFSVILPVMTAYLDDNPANHPAISELHAVTDLFVTACKKKRFYFMDISPYYAWIEKEITDSVKYYNVLEMRLDTVRGSVLNRSEWQRTLSNWNRVPTVFPDIVPPENIKQFVQGEVIHDIWIARKNTLDTAYTQAELMFNDSIPAGMLFQNYKNILSVLVSRNESTPTYDYTVYFTELFDKETNGEDIRPYLNQLNIAFTEYRVLKRIYKVLENGNAPLLPSEYADVINIAIRVSVANMMYFKFVQEEYANTIVLTGNDFQNYTPGIINFPLNMTTDTTVQWRSPNADKKAWKDTLNTRIERKKSVQEEWNDVVGETEDITMPVMRDALIQALRNNCETLDNTAERLAKTLFIETKDNCCTKHSRVSFAIETLQGLIFALENGIYDNYLNGFSLIAPDFRKEWEWLGSYATWRSAIFVYIYPENLLYPTLKRRQSPAFIELAETIQNANRFTPLNACQAAKKYQDYFEDVQNLKMVCTANARAYIFRKDPIDCCGDLNNSMQEYMTYYIAQSTLSGKGYYSEKAFYANSDEHDFWKAIPTMPKGAKIIGCLPLNREYDDNGEATKSALWLFYTYKEGGDLKLAYLKKDLMTAGSDWGEEETVDLPDFSSFKYETSNFSRTITTSYTAHDVVKITLCQNSYEWDFIYFIFSFGEANKMMEHIQFRYDPQDDKFSENLDDVLFFRKSSLPVTALVHWINSQAIGSNHLIGITLVFEDEIQTAYYGSMIQVPTILPHIETYQNLIGAFRQNQSDEKFVIAVLNQSGQTNYAELAFTYTVTAGSPKLHINRTNLTTSGHSQHILSIAPRFNFSLWEGGSAVTAYNNTINAGMAFRTSAGITPAETTVLEFVLTPEKRTQVAIESGECIDNYDLRTTHIKEHVRANLNAPQGNPISPLYRTTTIREVLYEAYYFVPMLIALDQQQRGDYPTALDWYRSVYDYANNLSYKRKIFYGLVLEASVTNVFDRPADWLQDPLNPHLIAQTRTNAYTKYTLMNIIQCMLAYGDREFTIDTIETVPNARKLYTEALDLLKVSELNIKPSACYTASHPCFETAVTAPVDSYWSNSFSELQAELEGLHDVALIEEASGELVEIFNGEGKQENKFTDAFTYLSEFRTTRAAASTNTVSSLMDGIGERMNDAYRYLFANIDTQSFNGVVGTHFTNTLATLNSMVPEQVSQPENQEKLSWLKEPLTANSQPLEFRFVNEEGIQLLGKSVAFNPMEPSPMAFQANLAFTNARVLYQPFLYSEDFTPFVDYAFCLPVNPVYSSLELKANLELFKIFNCRNIAGMERSLDIFAAPTDSTTGVPVIGAGGNLILPGTGTLVPSQYRFRVLMERAKQLVSQAQQLESQFLATLEKEDAENYSQLRARQDLQTAKATVKLQDLRVKQSELEKEVADLQLTKMQFVQNTYNGWISAGLNGYETASLTLLGASAATSGVASAANFIKFWDGDSIAQGFSNLASMLSTISSMMSQLASYQRRQQEWQYQSDLAGYDISIANQQIKIAEQNTRIVSQEREIASINMDHATDTLEFLKTKFTNAELYRWMGNVLERTYSYMLNLATSVAKTAEQQYYFEQQEQSGPFILADYWSVPQTGSLALTGGGVDRRGLTGSARLLQDITRLDQYAFETTKRKLQMTKVISLGQLYPDAFQSFRETGVLNFDLTNRLFDYDFPGHYLRLINGIKVSVVGLIPVYDNIKATLTAGTTSYTVINANNLFQQIPIRRMETEQVALTGASRATGVFEFQSAQGELLKPFEGMGIESHWEFKLPKFSNRMDYGNIADILVEIDYTALDSFQYRYQVLQDIDNTLGFSRGFSLRNDYFDQWYDLGTIPDETGPNLPPITAEFELKREQFPQGLDNIRLDNTELLLHFVRRDGFTDEITIQNFTLVSDTSDSNSGGQTINGTFKATYLTNLLSTQVPATPFVKLRLTFANTPMNRELFSKEHVIDILLLVNCKADLPVYPL